MSCGSGQHVRDLFCPDDGKTFCDKSLEGRFETKECVRGPCPTDGKWANWGPWGACSKSCGPKGVTVAKRECIPPQDGGRTCLGSDEKVY